MIKRMTVEGREALVHFLTKDRKPTNEAEAEMVHISFDDGESRWAFAADTDDKPAAEDTRPGWKSPRITRPR